MAIHPELLTNVSSPDVKRLAAIDSESITSEVLHSSVKAVEELYRDLGAHDQVAKGTQLLTNLKGILAKG